MRICVSGASGMVGSALVSHLKKESHEVVPLVRPGSRTAGIAWDPVKGTIEKEKLNGFDAVVHLAGENIAKGRWNAAKKVRIRESRVASTRLLSETLAQLSRKPAVLVSASAIGIYGDRGDELLTERSAAGKSFLAEVCQAWEQATKAASDAGIRVVHLRTGIVLSKTDGALAAMLTPFKLGGGGIVGSGNQYWSWISLEDEVRAIEHAIQTQSLHGPVNLVSPEAPTNRVFTKALGKALHRPTIFPMPAFAARLALGEMASELLLPSTRVVPQRLLETGFQFSYPDLEEALKHLLS